MNKKSQLPILRTESFDCERDSQRIPISCKLSTLSNIKYTFIIKIETKFFFEMKLN